jgi:hypothetical protein
MPFPVMTKQLATRLQGVLAAETIAGLTRASQQPGNPYGIERVEFGSAVGFVGRNAPPHGWWNRVICIKPSDINTIDAIIALYRGGGRRCHIDLDPLTLTPEIGEALATRGFAPAPNGTVLYGVSAAHAPAVTDDLEIREIGRHEASAFAELWADGFEIAGDDRAAALNIRKGWFMLPENRLYVAYIGGVAAGMAALSIHGRIGHLNVGATLPVYRGRGIHLALTTRRIADAALAGCELVMGNTGGFASTSQNNMERAGLRIAYTRVTMIDRAGF